MQMFWNIISKPNYIFPLALYFHHHFCSFSSSLLHILMCKYNSNHCIWMMWQFLFFFFVNILWLLLLFLSFELIRCVPLPLLLSTNAGICQPSHELKLSESEIRETMKMERTENETKTKKYRIIMQKKIKKKKKIR